jgi:cyclomaltodextrin glucanotransferase
VYYGSESGFEAGTNEHTGNRNYFGQDNVDAAASHPVHAALKRIANIRKNSVALQRGLQLNLEFTDDTAAFYRVYQKDGVAETALVLLNKGDVPVELRATGYPGGREWRDAMTGAAQASAPAIAIDAHSVRVLLSGARVTEPALLARLDRLQATARRMTP